MSMTDYEYALKIYCQVFNVDDDYGDAYVHGILETVASFDSQQQAAHECYYRDGILLHICCVLPWTIFQPIKWTNFRLTITQIKCFC